MFEEKEPTQPISNINVNQDATGLKINKEPKKNFTMKLNKNIIIIGLAVLLVVVAGILLFSNSESFSFNKSSEAIAKAAIDHLNNNVLQGRSATLVSFSKENGMVKVRLSIEGKEYDSYVTLDGKLFFSEPPMLIGSKPSNNTSGQTVTFNITQENHIRGSISAPITLVEFSDFECPFCVRHVPTLEKILSEYKDQVRLVYKHFPLASIHPNAQKAAEASECASEQGKFWEYHDLLFKNQSSGFAIEKFKSWAVQLGLNASQFNSCLDSSKYKDKVSADVAEGSSKGVNGTPATFINGELVEGSVPFETFKQKIEVLLAK